MSAEVLNKLFGLDKVSVDDNERNLSIWLKFNLANRYSMTPNLRYNKNHIKVN